MKLFKGRNQVGDVICLGEGSTFPNGKTQFVLFSGTKAQATAETIAQCKPLENISKGTFIITGSLEVGIFKEDSSVDSIEWN